MAVKIYRTPSHGCESFTLSYYQDGARKRPTFPDFGSAKAEAESIAGRLASADGAAYSRARQVLDPLDEWRCEQAFQLFPELVEFHKEKAGWNEFWVLWRRIAGGLDEPRQLQLWEYLPPHLAARLAPQPTRSGPKAKGIQPDGLEEMVRTAAALEHLPVATKTELGGWIAAHLRAEPTGGGVWAWALGRLGARVPLYGSSHRTVPPEIATAWLDLLLRPESRGLDGALFAVTQLARRTGDRSRDLDDSALALAALAAASAPPPWQLMSQEVATLDDADEARALGDSLPAGLKLRTAAG